MLLSLQGEHRTQPLVQTPFDELNAEVSPSGRWIAYQSDESDRDEIYVRPFPNVGEGRWQVSTGGGTQPLWSRNGQELFYVTPNGEALMSAPVSDTSSFKAGNPTKVVAAQRYLTVLSANRMYDVPPDGRRFVMVKAAESDRVTAPASMIVVQNWTEELKRRVPGP